MSRPLGQHDMLSFERTDKIQSCLGISRKFAAQSSRSTVFGVGVKLVGLGTVPSVDHSLSGVVTYGACDPPLVLEILCIMQLLPA